MRTDDYLRSFGMSGLLITNELQSVEERFNIELGHVPKAAQKSATEYYPQFELEVRREASQMAQHYEIFYCLEQAIRKVIIETLEEAEGEKWWDMKVASDIRKAAAELQKKEVDNGITPRSDRAIDYTTFGQLSVIISANWALFATVFKSPKAVEKVMTSLNLLRGPIAHCCPLTEHETNRLRLTVRDWFMLIG